MKDTASGGLAGTVYTHIKARILTGQARPGQVIAAHQIAQEMNVSRTPAHDALKRLVAEGYLVAQPRIGYTVTPINLDEVRDLFQIRIRLECLAAELAAAAFTPEHAAAFAAANKNAMAEVKRLAKRPSDDPEVVETMGGLHRSFHQMIAEISGNRRLVAMIGALQDEMQRFWALMPGYLSQSYVFFNDPEHQEMYDAIAAKDADRARASVVRHLRANLRTLFDALLPEDPPAGEPIIPPWGATLDARGATADVDAT
ncbi:GntR family transcriptional regulator [Aeromicrobium sp. UC242_57]|uniref:GntR family transcriptional regulator n=1 Tax=Aeromicrobium sp. UC242_57 TaxID=3374624 RepID=UPI0037B2A8D4